MMNTLIPNLQRTGLAAYADMLDPAIRKAEARFGDNNPKAAHYRELVGALPHITPSVLDADADRIRIGDAADISASDHLSLDRALKELMPWRKGPFDLFGIPLDAEWASDIKWNRVKDHISPLHGRRVLDIGSSCGYYLFRMMPHGPAVAIGIEPYATFYYQFKLLQTYIQAPDVFCLPVRLEAFPICRDFFDTIFCMGILYHRRSPLDTLASLSGSLRAGGELILETLIAPGDAPNALFPEDRYAKMNNVYFIPTVNCLRHWLSRCGFVNIRCVDISATTPDEQRKTAWMQFESLEDYLDSGDNSLTIEGYPAPVRAMVLAEAHK
ncbi:MAG: tRNA 5-methoxyuridine(34)/uridine 5-oxyacetic acid(34) synthase CmoB [Desulfobacteraceae bacterium]|nr:tRNA 5-methoxyuridine(34)/uridine 5-oxyacetic acid(34) synthase CmoB [Desulfobacteraceae bacterium]